MKIRSLFLALLVLPGTYIAAQPAQELYSIHLKTITIVPDANAVSFLDAYEASEGSIISDHFYKIVQFYDIPGNEDRAALADAGINLLGYLPEKAYFASFSTSFDAGSPGLKSIRSIIEIEAEYKLSSALYERNYPEHALQDNGNISLIASYYPDLEPEMATSFFQSAGFAVKEQYDFGKAVKLCVGLNEIHAVASLPFVLFLEPAGPLPVPDNYTGRTLHRSNALDTEYSTGRHYDGTGVAVVLQDDGIIGPHIDYEGRIPAQFPTNNGGNHGDHCAGILMGAGNVDPKVKGTASGSMLYVYNAPPSYPGFYNIPDDYVDLGVRITSTSYSDGCNAGYTFLAKMLDQQVNDFPSLMHVFSAGNDGNSNCNYGAGPGWGNITGGHKMGKNVITVGMVGWDDDLSDISSRGPAHDGRIKPDLVAKGRDVYSTIDPNTYGFKLGTSMSCPAVAGTLAQLFQAYRELNSGDDPAAGLMKAVLLNTAEDLGNPGPDFKFGWGRINGLSAVKVLEETRYNSGTIDQGELNSFVLDVPSGTKQIRVMAYWTDPEAAQNSDWTLVNNLDLSVTDPMLNTWLPWKLSHYPDPDSLNLPACRGVDDRNNMEQVTLDDPEPGAYTVSIEGFSVPEGPQDYCVVWEFITDDVILTYPVGGESLVPGEPEVIRWDAYGDDGTFLLECSSDNGSNWDTIVAELPGEERYYSWTVPPGSTGEALLRISKGTSASITDSPFSIIGVPCNLEVGWACEESVYLSWSPVMGATSYEVLALGEKYMEPFDNTTETSIIVQDPDVTTDSWFSVRALGPQSANGRRSIAVERPIGPLNCYPTDVRMEAIPTAEWGVYQSGNMDLTEVTVSAVVRNFGKEVVGNLPLKYKFDDNAEVGEIYPGTIEPNGVITFHFTQKINIQPAGNHTLKVWAEYPGDQNPENDVIEASFEVIDGTTVSLGYSQSFDAWQACISAPACELIVCNLEDGWMNLDNTVYDEHDWRTYSGTTPSPFTGPDSDHTTGTSSGKYLYMEPSLYCLIKTASIHMPSVDLTNGIAPVLSFWYHAMGPDIGQLHVDVFDGNMVIEDIMLPILGNQGAGWQERMADLSPWSGKTVALRFRGITSCREYGDLAIDDILVANSTGDAWEQLKVANTVTAYPNPCTGSFTLSLEDSYTGPLVLRIEDLCGRKIRSSLLDKKATRMDAIVDLSSVNEGFYLISGMDSNGQVLFRLKVLKI